MERRDRDCTVADILQGKDAKEFKEILYADSTLSISKMESKEKIILFIHFLFLNLIH